MELSGGRAIEGATVQRVLTAVVDFGFGLAGRVGDERVKSSSSTSWCVGRKLDSAGICVVSITGSTLRSFVGVADARHISSVVCLFFPADEVSDVPRGALESWAVSVSVRVFAFFAGSCEGEGRTGELSKSSVSIVSTNGGVFERPKLVPISAGRVFDRCIGARLLLLVTLGGRSTKAGDSDFSRSGRGTGAVLLCLTGDEDSKSITFCTDCEAGCNGNGSKSVGPFCVLANARESFEPGFVTFVNRSIGG